MPRITDPDFLSTRNWLIRLSKDDLAPDRNFFYLTAREQWDLHTYFQLTVELSDQVALAHRRDVTHAYPTLPQRAGRAMSRLLRLIEHGPEADPTYQRQRQSARRSSLAYADAHDTKLRVLTVRAEMKPELDAMKFAQALIQIARQRVADALESAAKTPPTDSPRTDPRFAGDSNHRSEAA